MIKLNIKGISKFFISNIVFVCILLAYITDYKDSMTMNGILIILKQTCILSYAVAGMMMIRIVGEINLGTGGVIAMVYFSLLYMWKVFRVSLSILIITAMIAALLLSWVYFFLNHCFNIPVLYFSFPLGTILSGLANYLTKYFNMLRFNTIDLEYKLSGFFGTSLWIWIWIFMFGFLAVLLRISPIGRSFYVVGSYKEIARDSGMPFVSIKQFAITLGILCIAITAVLNFINSGGNIITYTNIITYDVLVASCIGEGDFLVGKGTLAGALKGALGMVLLNMLLQANSHMNGISFLIKAVIFLISLSIPRFYEKLSKN